MRTLFIFFVFINIHTQAQFDMGVMIYPGFQFSNSAFPHDFVSEDLQNKLDNSKTLKNTPFLGINVAGKSKMSDDTKSIGMKFGYEFFRSSINAITITYKPNTFTTDSNTYNIQNVSNKIFFGITFYNELPNNEFFQYYYSVGYGFYQNRLNFGYNTPSDTTVLINNLKPSPNSTVDKAHINSKSNSTTYRFNGNQLYINFGLQYEFEFFSVFIEPGLAIQPGTSYLFYANFKTGVYIPLFKE